MWKWILVQGSFKCWRNKLTAFIYHEIKKRAIFIFCYLIANNQLKCGIKIALRVGDDEQIIKCKWPVKILQFYNWPTSTNFLINSCFTSSLINVK